jgi:hypothetical protein
MDSKSRAFGALLAVVAAVGCGSSQGEKTGTGGNPGSDGAAAADGGPISAPEATWTWVPLPGTTCGDGSTAGIGVNLATASPDLLVYMEGGGACWDASTCFVLNAAVQIAAPYTATQFQKDLTTLDAAGLFSRTNAASPFATASFAYVPYCTGDVHAGTTVQTYVVNGQSKTVHHTGGLNAQVIVDALHATLPNVSRVWLTGSSAGGYGATLNRHRYADAWPAAAIEVLQDSAPFVDVMGGRYPLWQQAWGIPYPPGCAACSTSFPAVIDAITTAYPSTRIGLLTYDEDATVKAFFAYPGSLIPAIDSLLANQYAHATTHAFVLAGASHTMLGSYRTLAAPDGTTLQSWVAQWATGDPAWQTVR